MKLERFTTTACCGRTSIIFKIDQSLSKEHLNKLVSLGYREHSHFTTAGIMYVDNLQYILTSPFGTNRIQVKCKIANCEKNLNELEALLATIG